MRLQVHKKAFRAFGISESFVKGASEKSVLAGIVMRSDRVIDGVLLSSVTIGGMDATEKIINMYYALKRDDINLIILNGCVISWYNVIDLHRVAEETERPLICVTYEESKGLEKYFKELFPKDWKERVGIYRKNKLRTEVTLKTGYSVFIRFLGMNLVEAKIVLNKFTSNGAIPEPVRVARLFARTTMKTFLSAS